MFHNITCKVLISLINDNTSPVISNLVHFKYYKIAINICQSNIVGFSGFLAV